MPARNSLPTGIHCAQDYETLAQQAIPTPVHAYIAGGSGRDQTLAANRAAFDRIDLLPRLLRDVTAGHSQLTLLGETLDDPILLAPLAFQTLVHPDGEIATARGAAATGNPIVCSTLSSYRLEDIAANAGPRRWFQLYFQPRREATLDLVERAEAAGYTALVVTLDASVQAPSLGSLRAGFQMPPTLRAANLAGHPAPAPVSLPEGASRILQGAMRDAPTWDDLRWLAGRTRLPLLVKGVLHPEDARTLRAEGVAGLVVSNHGGRGLDGSPASLEMLPSIRAALGPDYPLLLDGGIRSGSDVFKALALGADAVLIGRLQVYALAVAGALGVAHMLKLLREELEFCMALTGCATLADIGPDAIRR